MRHRRWSKLALGIVALAVSSCRDRPAPISPEPSGDERAEQIFYVDPARVHRELLSRARVHLESENGKVVGSRLFIDAGEVGSAPLDRLGFHSLDRIEAVDGVPVETLDPVSAAFARMGSALEVRFQVRRRGRQLTLVYRPATAGAGR